jgi:hypothetical protein
MHAQARMRVYARFPLILAIILSTSASTYHSYSLNNLDQLVHVPGHALCTLLQLSKS